MKLLLVEDDTMLANSLYSLFKRSYLVHLADRASSALERIANHRYDVIVLDLQLPDQSGQEVCSKIRTTDILTPIVILSGTVDQQTKTALLDAGANDYISKPFHAKELLARLRVQTRQRTGKTTANLLTVGDISIDTNKQIAWCNGLPLTLRRKEFTLLECLALNAPSTVHQEILSQYVWDDQDTQPSSIHVHISNLRKKLRAIGSDSINTVHGIGYALTNEPRKRPA